MESFEIHWVRHYLINVVLFGIKDMQAYEMTIKLKSNGYVRTVNILFPIWTLDLADVNLSSIWVALLMT